MKNLINHDASRCAGRFDLLDDTPPCARRGECARHRQLAIDQKRGQSGHFQVLMHCFKDGYPTLFIAAPPS